MTTPFHTQEQVEQAVAAAAAVAEDFASSPAHVRAAALDHVSRRLSERAEEFAQLINEESGKPLKWARMEVTRAVSTFRWAAEEARRFSGELQRLDTDPVAEGRIALIRRTARGPVLGIAPFNFPLNLVAHKVAPAIAVGAPIILKPAPATPKTAIELAKILDETDLPKGTHAVLHLSNEDTAKLVEDPRLPVISFTGSGPVGWGIKERVPRKHVTLELGGNAAAIVCPDWTDIDWVAQRIATFAMYQAGQSCISVQRVYVHADRYDELKEAIVNHAKKLDQSEDVGPLINNAAAERVEQWVNEAKAQGAQAEVGGTRNERDYAATVLTNVPEDAKVSAEEVFGPVVTISKVDSVEEAYEKVNASKYGLQAGVFTTDLKEAFRAAKKLHVGGVIIGDVPSYRADQMPYGGVKESGVGREGLRAAMEDLTEPRVLVLTGIEL